MAVRERYRFSRFVLDAAERRLLGEEDQIRLPPKTFDLLLALVRRHGRLVTKGELLQLVWPDTFVEEGILSVHVARLRRALVDSTRNGRLIETVSRSGYRFTGDVTAVSDESPARSRAIDTGTDPRAIAVLPFVNQSADPENEYFSDGLTEEIIHALTRVPELKVIARTSSFVFKQSRDDIRHIARTLGVATVLEGSVRRSGERLRVTVQLVSGVDATHIWSARYDRELGEVFAIQDEIAHAIVTALEVSPAAVTKPYTPVWRAFEAYLQALFHQRRLTPESLEKSRCYFEQANTLDPRFALARARMGQYFFALVAADLWPAEKGMPLVRAAANQALAIDPSLPEAHALLGWVATVYDYDWTAAHEAFTVAFRGRAIPPDVRTKFGVYLAAIGRVDEAIPELEQALRQDPFDHQARALLAGALERVGRSTEAAEHLRVMSELDPGSWLAQFLMGVFPALRGRFDEARPYAARAYDLAPWYSGVIGLLAGISLRTGAASRSTEVLRTLEASGSPGTPIGMAVFHLVSGDLDRAAEWFGKAIAQRHPRAMLVLSGAPRRLLESSAGWPSLARQLNLQPHDHQIAGTDQEPSTKDQGPTDVED
jgi:TolB-like protein/Tfp pilus assembly protein PilF